MSEPENEIRPRSATLAEAFRPVRTYVLVAVAGIGLLLGTRAYRMREVARQPSPPPARMAATPALNTGNSSSAPPVARGSLQEIGNRIGAIKKKVGKISDNLGKLSEDLKTPEKPASQSASDLNEATEKLRTKLDGIAIATEPGGKVETAIDSFRRAVAPDGPIADNLKKMEEKTAELAERRKTPKKSIPKPRDKR
jgi:hypothetical protein